jgi:hypothetical protein
MTLTLTPPYQDAIALLKSGCFQFGGVVGVKWGYASENLITDEYPFIINQPKVQFGRDTTITITGIDAFNHIAKLQKSISQYSRTDYPTDHELLGKIAQNIGYQLAIDPSSQAWLDSQDSLWFLNRTDTPVPTAKTDRELFRKICKNNNLVYTLGSDKGGNKLIIYDMQYVTKNSVTYNFYWYGNSVSDMDIPIINFTTNPLMTIFAPSSLRSQHTTSKDADSGQIKTQILDTATDTHSSHQGDKNIDFTITGTANLKDQRVQLESGTLVIPAHNIQLSKDGNTIEAIRVGEHTPVPDRSLTRYNKNNQARDVSRHVNTRATLIAPGHPDLIPPLNIYVRGVGGEDLFDGAYYILSSKHTIGTSGYEMSHELIRTTTAKTGNVAANTQEAPGESTAQPAQTPKSADDTTRAVANPTIPPSSISLGLLSSSLGGLGN